MWAALALDRTRFARGQEALPSILLFALYGSPSTLVASLYFTHVPQIGSKVKYVPRFLLLDLLVDPPRLVDLNRNSLPLRNIPSLGPISSFLLDKSLGDIPRRTLSLVGLFPTGCPGLLLERVVQCSSHRSIRRFPAS